MLKNYPIKINNTEIPYYEDIGINYERKKETYITESGVETDIVLTASKKAVIQYSTICKEWRVATFNAFADQYSLEVKYYDPSTRAYVTKTMRMEDYSVKLLKGSEDLAVTNGIYEVSFTLREF